MDHSVTFARHFARLLWLLVHEPSNIDEQKATLRALVIVSRDGPVSLAVLGDELTANTHVLPAALTGVADLVTRMTAHGIAIVGVDAAAAPADLLGVARILTGAPSLGDGGAAAEAKREALGARTVRFTPRTTAPREAAPIADSEFGELVEDPIAEAARRATPRTSVSIEVPAAGDATGLFDQFASARAPSVPHEALLAELDRATDSGRVIALLDELVTIAEHAARDGKPAVVSEIMHRIVQREGSLEEFEAKRAVVMALRRLAKPLVLRAVTMQLPHRAERRADLVAILARVGEDGADAVVEQLTNAAAQSDRRVYFDALIQLQAGVPTLTHMLGDARWFVVRNAADLLGELQAVEAEGPLAELLHHGDDRVRRSATAALMRLGTPRAVQAVEGALKDGAPPVRMQAAAALAARKEPRTGATLLRALDAERDEEVQAAFLLALGRLGTAEAVERLVRTSEPERGLFRRKSTALRVAAVQGLAEARSDRALEALRALAGDRDGEVKNAASFALARLQRRSGELERPTP